MKATLRILYNLDEDTAQKMADELDHAIERGVEVRIIIDGSLHAIEEWRQYQFKSK